jgi:hypothetical protein
VANGAARHDHHINRGRQSEAACHLQSICIPHLYVFLKLIFGAISPDVVLLQSISAMRNHTCSQERSDARGFPTLTSVSYEPVTNRPWSTGYQATLDTENLCPPGVFLSTVQMQPFFSGSRVVFAVSYMATELSVAAARRYRLSASSRDRQVKPPLWTLDMAEVRLISKLRTLRNYSPWRWRDCVLSTPQPNSTDACLRTFSEMTLL